MRIRQVLVSATLGVLVATGASAGAAATPDSIQTLVAGMSLEQKVGQLFATYVYGDTATTTDPAYTSQNQAAYGVDNGAQVVAKYHLGSVI
jgi:beta-N-acetylhexosaminidase